MIPEFPEFKKLELADKDEIENFTKQFPPYSDFNFVSMWSWDIKGDMRVAWLNGNLVVKFNDYLTGDPFYSFLGTNKVNDTAAMLIEVSKVLGQKASIGLIPEVTAQLLDTEEFVVLEDRDQFDYIFDLKFLSKMEGSRFASKRTDINKFKKNNPEARVEILDFSNFLTKEGIKKLNQFWLNKKLKNDSNNGLRNEFIAIDKFFEAESINDVFVTGILINSELKAYFLAEKISKDYIVCHYCKVDISYDGIYPFLIKETSQILCDMGFVDLNFEQDLGIEGLRKSKTGFSNGTFFKKYSILFK